MGQLAIHRVSIQFRDAATHAFGGLLGGLVGAAVVVAVTSLLKLMMDFLALQTTWMLVVIPLIGLALSVFVLQVLGRSELSPAGRFRTFPSAVVRSDITGDVVSAAGHEERFPWRLAPIRLAAIFCTVGSGAGMGTEAPAAYLGVASGACLGDRGGYWRRLLRPAAVGGGAAGVAALMGIPLVGTAYVLEIGRRNGAPYDVGRVVAALVGGVVGWAINCALGLNLIRLVVPREAPTSLKQALVTALFIGALSGGITSLAASALYWAKRWGASPVVRLSVGGLIAGAAALALAIIAGPAAAFGPGGGAILWAETNSAPPSTLLAVSLLRAAITTADVAAGGCGGVFVPFLAIGDLAGRVFAPGFGVGHDLAGAAGAAASIAGGYRLPLAATAMVLGVGGPHSAMLTCLAVVVVAYLTDKLNPFKR